MKNFSFKNNWKQLIFIFTSVILLATTILTAVFLYKQVQENKNYFINENVRVMFLDSEDKVVNDQTISTELLTLEDLLRSETYEKDVHVDIVNYMVQIVEAFNLINGKPNVGFTVYSDTNNSCAFGFCGGYDDEGQGGGNPINTLHLQDNDVFKIKPMAIKSSI
ncbi:hypothetical protein NPX79_01310 [Spiroplasma endosymbiont of Anurida maritima]|uniref:hypothetical protein n=1 Tax=Spiroplasma endosymbiont of Anurida maritima TaxID=2967972 RepID=UPI0036D39F1D